MRYMRQSIQQKWQNMTSVRPWVAVAILIAAPLLIYFAYQGALWYQATEDRTTAREDIERLDLVTRNSPGDTKEQEAQLVATTIQLDNLRRMYEYPFTDKLMSIVSETAREANLDLASMTVDRIKIEPQVTLQYLVQPMSIRLNGTPANVQEFLAALYERVPVVVATNASMVNLSQSPSAQIQLLFFLSPEQIPDEDS